MPSLYPSRYQTSAELRAGIKENPDYPNGKMTIVPIELPTSVSKWKSILNAVFCLLPRTPLWLHRRGGVWDLLLFRRRIHKPASGL